MCARVHGGAQSVACEKIAQGSKLQGLSETLEEGVDEGTRSGDGREVVVTWCVGVGSLEGGDVGGNVLRLAWRVSLVESW